MFQHVIAMAGLALMVLGWALQYRQQLKGKMGLAREFVGLCVIGFILCVMDSIQTGAYEMAFVYAVLLAMSLLVFFKTED